MSSHTHLRHWNIISIDEREKPSHFSVLLSVLRSYWGYFCNDGRRRSEAEATVWWRRRQPVFVQTKQGKSHTHCEMESRTQRWLHIVSIHMLTGNCFQGGSSGRWKTPHQNAKMSEKVDVGAALDVGDEGIWVTFARGMRAKAMREFKQLCEEVSGPSRAALATWLFPRQG